MLLIIFLIFMKTESAEVLLKYPNCAIHKKLQS